MRISGQGGNRRRQSRFQQNIAVGFVGLCESVKWTIKNADKINAKISRLSGRLMFALKNMRNVFLNSRLDANFIKDIIIRSMSEEEANIDLGYFRRQVADFEQEYRDISCWYKQNQKGESVVRKQAEAVVYLPSIG